MRVIITTDFLSMSSSVNNRIVIFRILELVLKSNYNGSIATCTALARDTRKAKELSPCCY